MKNCIHVNRKIIQQTKIQMILLFLSYEVTHCAKYGLCQGNKDEFSLTMLLNHCNYSVKTRNRTSTGSRRSNLGLCYYWNTPPAVRRAFCSSLLPQITHAAALGCCLFWNLYWLVQVSLYADQPALQWDTTVHTGLCELVVCCFYAGETLQDQKQR